MTLDPVYEHGASLTVEKYFDQICKLYDAAFSAPPFAWSDESSQEHSDTLAQIRLDESFEIVVARLGAVIIGFSYGHRLPVGHGWWGDFPDPLPSGITTEWEGRTFALIDLAVDKQWRGRGIGKALIALLLAGRQEERAVLSVQPTVVEAQQIYMHLGWQRVGRKGPMAGVTPPCWDIFLIDLPL